MSNIPTAGPIPNGESHNTDRFKIYKDATLKLLTDLRKLQKTITGANQKDKKDTEIALLNFTKELKETLNTNVGDIYIFKTHKYTKYLEDSFIPGHYEEVFTTRNFFFKVLEDSGFINNEEANHLFSTLIRHRKQQIGDQWSTKKKISTSPSDFDDMEYFKALEDVFDALIKEEEKKIESMKPTLEKAWREFSELFNKIDFPSMGLRDVRLAMYGSSQNAFKTAASDIDFTLLTGCYVDERLLLKIIKEYFDEFKSEKLIEIEVKKTDNNNIRIPHLQFKYKSFEFDLTVNNIFGVVNTRLLDAYASLDERCRKLGVLAKIWAKNNEICNGQEFLSSYCYVILVIGFLQNLKEPILPALQKIVSPVYINLKRVLDNETKDTQQVNIAFEEDHKVARGHLKLTKNSNLDLGRLFLLFVMWLEEMAKTSEDTVSIKNGCLMPREETYQSITADMNKNPSNFVFSVEDPFDRTHDLGKNFRKNNNKSSNNGYNEKPENREKFIGVLKETISTVKKFCRGEISRIQLEKIFGKMPQ